MSSAENQKEGSVLRLNDLSILRNERNQAKPGLPGPECWLTLHYHIDDPSAIKFYFSNAPIEIASLALVRISGMS
jgi:hypothetical protein